MATLAKRTAEAAQKVPVTVHGGSGEVVQPSTSHSGATGGVTVRLGDPVVSGSLPAPVALHWAKPEGDTLRSMCGKFSIHRITVGPFTTYELWKLVPSANWFTCLRQGLESSVAAKAIAQAQAGERL